MGFETFYQVSETGTLVFVPGLNFRPARRLTWADREGNFEPASANTEPYVDPSLSPRGDRLAIAIALDRDTQQIWSLDLIRDALTRLTFVEGRSALPRSGPPTERASRSRRTTR